MLSLDNIEQIGLFKGTRNAFLNHLIVEQKHQLRSNIIQRQSLMKN